MPERPEQAPDPRGQEFEEVHSREVATWQTHEWPSGRCANPRARRTLLSRRALLFPYYLQYRAKSLSLAAPTITSHPARFSLDPWRVYGIFACGYEGGLTLGRIMCRQGTRRIYRIVVKSELGDSYTSASPSCNRH